MKAGEPDKATANRREIRLMKEVADTLLQTNLPSVCMLSRVRYCDSHSCAKVRSWKEHFPIPVCSTPPSGPYKPQNGQL